MKKIGEAPLDRSAVEGYDGQLLHVIDGPFDRHYPLILIDHELRNAYASANFQDVLSNHKLYEQLPALNPLEREKYPDKIRSLIYDGRLLVTTLLTSPGGFKAVLHSVQRMHEEVERRKGDSVVFVGSSARSAAALLFADHKKKNRYCMSNSRFLWHAANMLEHDVYTGLSYEEHAKAEQVLRDMDNRAINQFFAKEVSGADSAEFLQYVHKTLNDSGDLWMQGKDLHFYNVIGHVSHSILEMRDAFESVTGLPGYLVEPSSKTDIVHRFFMRTALEQCIAHVTNRPVTFENKKWRFEPESDAQSEAWKDARQQMTECEVLDDIVGGKPHLPLRKTP